MRVRRSLLWVNGYDAEKLREGIESDVDSIVLDLEDGVTVPRSYGDYTVTVDEAALPVGVTCTRLG